MSDLSHQQCKALVHLLHDRHVSQAQNVPSSEAHLLQLDTRHLKPSKCAAVWCALHIACASHISSETCTWTRTSVPTQQCSRTAELISTKHLAMSESFVKHAIQKKKKQDRHVNCRRCTCELAFRILRVSKRSSLHSMLPTRRVFHCTMLLFSDFTHLVLAA